MGLNPVGCGWFKCCLIKNQMYKRFAQVYEECVWATFIRKVILCEPPFEAVQLNIQYLSPL